MFNDRKKALEELEAELLLEELLEEEAQEEEQWEEEQPLYRNFSNNYGRVEAYNRDVDEADLEDYVEQVRKAEKPGNVQGLIALALALLAGIFVVLAFWAVRYL